MRLSLLRAPLFPDPETDQGSHRLRYAVVPGAGIADAVREGYRINLPLRVVSGAAGVEPILAVDNDNVIVEALKLADDESGDVVVRLYESLGAWGSAMVLAGFEFGGWRRSTCSSARWRPLGSSRRRWRHPGPAPFQVVTLRFTRSA